jgi:hypothetical protein
MPDGQEPLATQALATFVLTLYDDLEPVSVPWDCADGFSSLTGVGRNGT